MKNIIRVVSLFSGIGAFEKALKNIGVEHEVLNYCEIDKFASCAYSVLHQVPEVKNLGDISKVKTESISEFDLLTYGFPCQDISLAGNMKGIIKGETRSGLLFEALKIIHDKKPKYAIAENVKNLVSKRFESDFKAMLDELDELGYNSYWKVLNAKDYGSYQSRERVFIVSIRKDVDNGKFIFPEPIENKCAITDILETNIDEKYYCSGNYIKDFVRKSHKKLVDNKERSKFGLLKVGDINKPTMREMNKRVFSPEGLSPTLVTGSDSIPKFVECRVRKLTPLESWRATGFTAEDFLKVRETLENRFYKGNDRSDTQMYKMAGNSISVEVLEAIFRQLFYM